MSIRFRTIFALVVLSILAVAATATLIFERAIAEKRNYVTELNSVLVAQLRSNLDVSLDNLVSGLSKFSLQFMNPKINDVELQNEIKKIQDQFSYLNGIIILTNKQQVGVKINGSEQDYAEAAQKFNTNYLSQISLNAESAKLRWLGENTFYFTIQKDMALILFVDDSRAVSLFESARGKQSFIVNSTGQVLLSGLQEGQQAVKSIDFKTIDLTGVNLFGTEITWADKTNKLVYLSKIQSIDGAYALVVNDVITWQDLALPLMKSSLSLIAVLILLSVLLAVSFSKSLVKPIETIADEAANVGKGNWQNITVDASTREITYLAASFNKMINNLKKREDDLQKANQKIVQSESLAAVGRIGAGIAHEVKNPLASVLGYGQLVEMNLKNLESDNINENLKDKVSKIKNYNKLILDDTRRASRIISDLLTFARQKELQTTRTPVLEYIDSVSNKLRTICESENVQFALDVEKLDKSVQIEIDQDQIYQVLFNLVQNATHAMKNNSADKKQVKLIAVNHAEVLELKVHNSGPAIPKEIQDKIFEPFFSTKKVGEGSGLGLAISYGIMQKHNGQIVLKSNDDEGTEFTLKLPIVSS
jgi:signal transduction histidine kinase